MNNNIIRINAQQQSLLRLKLWQIAIESNFEKKIYQINKNFGLLKYSEMIDLILSFEISMAFYERRLNEIHARIMRNENFYDYNKQYLNDICHLGAKEIEKEFIK